MCSCNLDSSLTSSLLDAKNHQIVTSSKKEEAIVISKNSFAILKLPTDTLIIMMQYLNITDQNNFNSICKKTRSKIDKSVIEIRFGNVVQMLYGKLVIKNDILKLNDPYDSKLRKIHNPIVLEVDILKPPYNQLTSTEEESKLTFDPISSLLSRCKHVRTILINNQLFSTVFSKFPKKFSHLELQFEENNKFNVKMLTSSISSLKIKIPYPSFLYISDDAMPECVINKAHELNEFFKALEHCKNLTSLDLESSDDFCLPVSYELPKQITDIRLKFELIGKDMAASLIQCKHLNSIKIISEKSSPALREWLASDHGLNIKKLDLRSAFGMDLMRLEDQKLTNVFKNLKDIEYLSLPAEPGSTLSESILSVIAKQCPKLNYFASRYDDCNISELENFFENAKQIRYFNTTIYWHTISLMERYAINWSQLKALACSYINERGLKLISELCLNLEYLAFYTPTSLSLEQIEMIIRKCKNLKYFHLFDTKGKLNELNYLDSKFPGIEFREAPLMHEYFEMIQKDIVRV